MTNNKFETFIVTAFTAITLLIVAYTGTVIATHDVQADIIATLRH